MLLYISLGFPCGSDGTELHLLMLFLAVTGWQIFPVFDDSGRFEEFWYFLNITTGPQLEFIWIFTPHRQAWVMDFRKEIYKVPLYSILTMTHTINLIRVINNDSDVDLDHLARLVFSRFSHCLYPTPPPPLNFPYCLLRHQFTTYISNLRSGSLSSISMKAVYYSMYLQFFYK